VPRQSQVGVAAEVRTLTALPARDDAWQIPQAESRHTGVAEAPGHQSRVPHQVTELALPGVTGRELGVGL